MERTCGPRRLDVVMVCVVGKGKVLKVRLIQVTYDRFQSTYFRNRTRMVVARGLDMSLTIKALSLRKHVN